MADCSALPTRESSELFEQDAGTINEIITSSDDLTPPASDGEQKKTLAGIYNDANAAVSSAISALSLVDIGNYEDNETFNNYNEYVVFERSTNPTRWRVNGNVTLPYTVNSSINPSADPNLYGSPTFLTMPDPDVYLPFGNKIVDSVCGSLDFARASATSSINKSGVSEELGVDEPAITKDGLSVYSSYTNELLYSEDFSAASWSKGGVSVSGATEVVESASLGEHSLRQASLISTSDLYSISVKVKKGAGSARSLRIRFSDDVGFIGSTYLNLTTGLVYSESAEVTSNVEYLGDGYYLFSAYIPSSSVNPECGLYLAEEGSAVTAYQGDGVSSLIIDETQLVTSKILTLPYVKTTDTPVTRAPDIASIPMMSNMPAAGRPFTIVVDCALPTTDGVVTLPVFWNENNNITLYRAANDRVAFRMVDVNGGSRYAQSGIGFNTERHRLIAWYDGTEIRLYSDGSLLGASSTLAGPRYSVDSELYIGSNGARSLGSEISNFKIFHRALSSAEIAAMGAAE